MCSSSEVNEEKRNHLKTINYRSDDSAIEDSWESVVMKVIKRIF